MRLQGGPLKAARVILALAIVISLTATTGCIKSDFGDEQKRAQEKVEKPVYNFTVRTIDGRTFTMAEHKGRIVLLEFFWTSCGPCEDMLPTFRNIDNNYDMVDIVSISVGDSDTEQDLIDYRQEHTIQWPMAKDNGTLKSVFSVDVAPTMYLVAQNQTVVWAHVGSVKEKELTTEINKLI